MTWSFLACKLVPSSMIPTICKHWHAHVLRYHFSLLWCKTNEVFKTFAFLTCTQKSNKTSKMALDLQHQSAVFSLPCTAFWVRVTQILSAILKKVQLRGSVFWPEISRPGCSLLNVYHLAFQDFYQPPLPMFHNRWKVLPLSWFRWLIL